MKKSILLLTLLLGIIFTTGAKSNKAKQCKSCLYRGMQGKACYIKNKGWYKPCNIILGEFNVMIDPDSIRCLKSKKGQLRMTGYLYSNMTTPTGEKNAFVTGRRILKVTEKDNVLSIDTVLAISDQVGYFSFTIPKVNSNSYLLVEQEDTTAVSYEIAGFKLE